MRRKLVLKFIVLMTLAVVIGLLSYNFLKRDEDQSIVFIASRDIEMHSIIKNEDIKMVTVNTKAKETFFKDAIASKKDLIGTVTTMGILKDDVFMDTSGLVKDTEAYDVINDQGQVIISSFLSEDDRIGFITIDQKNALGSMIDKGDFIDIIYTSQTNDTGGLYTNLLLEKVAVYKVSENATSSALLDIHFTITPEQGMLLTLAKYTGHLDFLLSSENASDYEGMPILPEDLYKQLLQAGYQLSGEQVAPTSESDLQEEIRKAEERLTEALEALSLAKSSMSAKEDLSLEEVVKSLEGAVRDLETTVDKNTELLEEMREDE